MMIGGLYRLRGSIGRLMVKHCSKLNLTVSDDSARYQPNFVKKMNQTTWVNWTPFE